MKICICICGLKRCLYLVLEKLNKLFYEHEVEIILILSNNHEKEYLHHYQEEILNNYKTLYLIDEDNHNFRNSINYSNKILYSLKLIEDKYDLYMIIRSDLILESINLDSFEKNTLYFSNKNLNQYSIHHDRVNDNIIITKDYSLLQKLLDLHYYNEKNQNYLDIILYKYLESNLLHYKLIPIEYKLILSECNIIAIAGDSGSGKTTLSQIVNLLFEKEASILETDRYHKWERGDENYQNFTHLNPYANHLEKMNEDIYQLKIGSDIYQVDYDHSSGKFTQKQKIENTKNLIVCGLHTLYQQNMNELLNLKIYLDTERELIKKWKIKRDVIERGYSLEKVLKQIELREKDYNAYILYQKKNADIIIHFYELNEKIECNFIIQNDVIKNKMIDKIILYKYELNIDTNKNVTIKLKKNIECIHENIRNIVEKNDALFKNNYFKEILSLISLIY
jgi:uridine kinase